MVVEPVPFNEPVTVIATVVTEVDYQGLEIRIGSKNPTVMIDVPHEEYRTAHSIYKWVGQVVETEAGVPLQVSTELHFTEEGIVRLTATAIDESTGLLVENDVCRNRKSAAPGAEQRFPPGFMP